MWGLATRAATARPRGVSATPGPLSQGDTPMPTPTTRQRTTVRPVVDLTVQGRIRATLVSLER